MVFSTEEQIANDPELMQGFVSATVKGYEEVIADPQVGLDALLAENEAIPEDFAEASLEAYEPLFQGDADGSTACSTERTSRTCRRSWSTRIGRRADRSGSLRDQRVRRRKRE